jgi:DNA-binding NarL/FixJ family response regulator
MAHLASNRPIPKIEDRSRLLLVEDDYIVSMEMEAALGDAGFHVVGIANSADQAVRLATKEHPALVIMDIRLIGKRDGVDAAVDIYRTTGIRSLFVTAHHGPDMRARAAPAEPLGWLPKPYSAPALIAAITQALGGLN